MLKTFAVAAILMLPSLAAIGAQTVSVVYVGDEDDHYLGFRQALDEANRQGRFLGITFEQRAVDAADQGSQPLANGVSAVFGALDSQAIHALARRHADVPVFNLASRDDALRRNCQRNLFHAPPSRQMLADARQQWAAAGNDPDDVQVRAWNTEFRRYAAIQVSKRFEESQGRPMSDAAYAAWAATRLFAQVVVEQSTTDPAALIEALHGDVQFDGAKGVPMQFRATGQLNQMLLLEQDGRVVGTAPVRGVHEPHELETLGYVGCEE